MASVKRRCHDSGAAAVEFALLAPVLLLLLIGIVEFGRVYNAQVTVTAAAREGAREMAVRNDLTAAIDRVMAAAPALNPALSAGQISIIPADCQAGNDVSVEVTYPVPLLTGIIVDEITVTGRGVMRCGG